MIGSDAMFPWTPGFDPSCGSVYLNLVVCGRVYSFGPYGEVDDASLEWYRLATGDGVRRMEDALGNEVLIFSDDVEEVLLGDQMETSEDLQGL